LKLPPERHLKISGALAAMVISLFQIPEITANPLNRQAWAFFLLFGLAFVIPALSAISDKKTKEEQTEKERISALPKIDVKLNIDKVSSVDFHLSYNITNAGQTNAHNVKIFFFSEFVMYSELDQPPPYKGILAGATLMNGFPVPFPYKKDDTTTIYIIVEYTDVHENISNCGSRFVIANSSLAAKDYFPIGKNTEAGPANIGFIAEEIERRRAGVNTTFIVVTQNDPK
jgi:Na+/melibiose symporter-like transporter